MKHIKCIAVEEGFSTPEVLAAHQDVLRNHPEREPGLYKLMANFDDTLWSGWAEKLTDLGAGRIAEMDKGGIDKQVLCLSAPGLQIFDPVQAMELSRNVNERLAMAMREHPDRFAGLAAVPPQCPREGAIELERAVRTLGLKGLLINSHTRNEYLDDPKFRPLFEALSSLNVPLYLHPREPSAQLLDAYIQYGLEGAIWGYAAEVALHSLRLILSGLFDDFPNLRVVIGHGGEGIPFFLGRIDNRYANSGHSAPGRRRLKMKPSDYFLRNFAISTSGMIDHAPLRLCIDMLGIDNVMFAVDYPFERIGPAVASMDSAPLSDEERTKFLYENAERIFNL